MDFNVLAAGMAIEEIAVITNRHPSSIRRYKRTNKAPVSIIRLLATYKTGKIPSTDTSWNGWRVRGAMLVDPDGNEYTAEEIKSIWAVRQLKRELELLMERPMQLGLL